MKIYSKDLIEYKIENPLIYDINSSNFTSFYIDTIISLDPFKLPIDNILKVQLSSIILSNRTIKTPKGTSLEGFSLTGFKSIIIGECIIKMQYTTTKTSMVYGFSHAIPFVECIILQEEIGNNKIYPYIFVEDAFIKKVDNYNINFNCSLICII